MASVHKPHPQERRFSWHRPSTRVTATLANASEHRSIFGQYAQTPIYHKPVTVEAPLDEKGCLTVELPLTEAKVLSVGPQREVKLFLEPGDQLHLDADLCSTFLSPSAFPAKARPTTSSSPPCGPASPIT